ncbi:hypothetical protein NA56DRAFT_711158 [Hyaloscypha hepaticicola]|uniref:Ubiquitin-like protease family profile domain-containing protein n=1 Tax=Hyaloscypha hepaticicola TaxID=2082293 RepID=A0A2J6PJV9_9HELO|nr:hypothetical protein NA56DRAFT_711158 [Hyaloscypha hepaticicola]
MNSPSGVKSKRLILDISAFVLQPKPWKSDRKKPTASICPQRDGWSCGLMVIRNAKRRVIGLPVGSWDDEVNLDRVMKEVVGDCQTFLEDDALQPSPLSKKRKRRVEGLPNNVFKPSRSSKRLRVVTEGS